MTVVDFSTSDTWVVPTGATIDKIECWGQGGAAFGAGGNVKVERPGPVTVCEASGGQGGGSANGGTPLPTGGTLVTGDSGYTGGKGGGNPAEPGGGGGGGAGSAGNGGDAPGDVTAGTGGSGEGGNGGTGAAKGVGGYGTAGAGYGGGGGQASNVGGSTGGAGGGFAVKNNPGSISPGDTLTITIPTSTSGSAGGGGDGHVRITYTVAGPTEALINMPPRVPAPGPSEIGF